MTPVYFIQGWPQNHDWIRLFERVGIYREELLNGVLRPHWTSYGQHAYGSIFPFLYHSFFDVLAGSIAVLTNSVYLSIRIAIPIILFIGAVGMYKLIKKLEMPLIYSLCAGTLYIFANYTYSNWLIRGDAAELSAMSFIPWFYLYLIQIFQTNKDVKANWVCWLGVKIGLVLACLFYSHLVIFYYSFLSLIVFFLVNFINNKNYLKFNSYKTGIAVIITLFITCGAHIIGILFFKPFYNMSALLGGFANVETNYISIWKYLINLEYVRGKSQALPIEIGRVFNLGSIFFTFVVIIFLLFKKIPLKNIKLHIFISLFICSLIYIYLQLPYSIWFYHYIPQANFIQFPWRLETFLTVLSIIFLCTSLHTLQQRFEKFRYISILIILFCAIYQTIFEINIPLNYGIISKDYLIEHLRPGNLLISDEPGEYLPNTGFLPPTPMSTIEIKQECQMISIIPNNIDHTIMPASEIVITVQGIPNQQCKITYNQFINPFTEVVFSKSGKVTASEQSTYIILPTINETQTITIKRIGLINAIIKFLLNHGNLIRS